MDILRTSEQSPCSPTTASHNRWYISELWNTTTIWPTYSTQVTENNQIPIEESHSFSFWYYFPDKILECGCAEEVEIRGASIYVVEELKKAVLAELKQNHPNVPTQNVNSILLDHFLWDYRRKNAAELEYIPFHKTIGIFYWNYWNQRHFIEMFSGVTFSISLSQ